MLKKNRGLLLALFFAFPYGVYAQSMATSYSYNCVAEVRSNDDSAIAQFSPTIAAKIGNVNKVTLSFKGGTYALNLGMGMDEKGSPAVSVMVNYTSKDGKSTFWNQFFKQNETFSEGFGFSRENNMSPTKEYFNLSCLLNPS